MILSMLKNAPPEFQAAIKQDLMAGGMPEEGWAEIMSLIGSVKTVPPLPAPKPAPKPAPTPKPKPVPVDQLEFELALPDTPPAP